MLLLPWTLEEHLTVWGQVYPWLLLPAWMRVLKTSLHLLPPASKITPSLLLPHFTYTLYLHVATFHGTQVLLKMCCCTWIVFPHSYMWTVAPSPPRLSHMNAFHTHTVVFWPVTTLVLPEGADGLHHAGVPTSKPTRRAEPKLSPFKMR